MPAIQARTASHSVHRQTQRRLQGGNVSERDTSVPIPRWTPCPRELDDLEVLLMGGYAPLRGFLDADDVRAVTEQGELADGTPWPVPVTLVVPGELAAMASRAGALTVLDEEGAPVAEVAVEGVWQAADGRYGVAGPVRSLIPRAPALERGRADRPVLGVPFDRPLYQPTVAAIGAYARAEGMSVLLLPLTGRSRAGGMEGSALVRSCRDAAAALGAEVRPVPVPLHPDQARKDLVPVLVAQACGATRVSAPTLVGAGIPVVVDLPDVALDRRTDRWVTDVAAEQAADVESRDVAAQVGQLVAVGETVPHWLADAAVVRELRRSYRPGGGCGFTVLFSGLSGSGKSTIARAVHDALLDHTDRTVTLLDGDVVRRMLASELGFSRAHRELNVRRIGFVAAELTRHGGIALCAPIAPYEAMRTEVRAMVSDGGGFLLVHVSTPLEVCEARDRKGLYARARAGQIPEFTGISDPYEPPDDAELVIDAAQVPIPEAVRRVLAAVAERGWLVV